jgi:hypothetical protein
MECSGLFLVEPVCFMVYTQWIKVLIVMCAGWVVAFWVVFLDLL